MNTVDITITYKCEQTAVLSECPQTASKCYDEAYTTDDNHNNSWICEEIYVGVDVGYSAPFS